jgi:hypothetical protein
METGMRRLVVALCVLVTGATVVGSLASKSRAQVVMPTLPRVDQWPPKPTDVGNLIVQGVNVAVGWRVTLTSAPAGQYLVITSYTTHITAVGMSAGSFRLREIVNGVDTLKSMWAETSFAGFEGSGLVFAPGSDVVLDNTADPYPAAGALPFAGDIRLTGYFVRR